MNASIKKDATKNNDIKPSFNIPKTGDVIEGTIFQINKSGIFVDLKNFKTGIIYAREIKEHPEYFRSVKIGEKILMKITKLENENGYVELSLKEAGSELKWKELGKTMEEKKIVEGEVLKANKGGLILDINGIQAFLPVSQLSAENYPRVEGGDTQKILQALQKLVAKSLKVKIIGFSPEEGKLIVSEKATQEKEIEEILKKYKVGDIVEGVVTGIVDFGVFIKFDSLEGLAHISELAYQLIENPRDIVKIGEKIKAKIIDVDKDKISLSIKALQENPWDKVEKKYQVDQIVKGTVTKFNPFGAFVQLDKNIHGLAHISEFETEKKMTDALKIGEKYEFKILSIKPSEYRMALRPLLKKE